MLTCAVSEVRVEGSAFLAVRAEGREEWMRSMMRLGERARIACLGRLPTCTRDSRGVDSSRLLFLTVDDRSCIMAVANDRNCRRDVLSLGWS